MKTRFLATTILLSGLLTIGRTQTTPPTAPTGIELFNAALQHVSSVFDAGSDGSPRTFSTGWKLVEAKGLPKQAAQAHGNLAIASSNRIRASFKIDQTELTIARNHNELWIYAPLKKFGVVGKSAVPRFQTAPEKIDRTQLGPMKLPVSREQLALLPFLCEVKSLEDTQLDGTSCRVISATPKPEAIQALKLPSGTLTFTLRVADSMPLGLRWTNKAGVDVALRLSNPQFQPGIEDKEWSLAAREGDRIETTALSHLTRALTVMLSSLNQQIPTLGPATGERRLLAIEGKGRLESVDGTRVLHLEGSPEEMGHQQGVLMRKSVQDLVEKVLYGVGVGSSFEKGRWFFGEIEEAQRRLNPFIDPRYLREMDSLAMATKLDREEIRLANFFPELFHCSGFAVYGDSTVGGTMYHGRILDYLRGIGLEQNAVVMVFKPDQGHAWVNVGYAGFVGSVTAMNEKKVAIGEMGGRGEGNWDGKPMAQLVREVMEKAGTIEEALEIMKGSPRTCEYYYVISDGKTKRAVGIAATPTTFETIWAGESHPKLPHAFKDAVLMSAGDRYEALAKRVKEGYGKIDASGARDLMTKPVCMGSNIHSVLFAPETLEFWVANADSKNVASHSRYTHYHLEELLKPFNAKPAPRSGQP
jgi:isopenicillin-N N-acyltransferase-like protein